MKINYTFEIDAVSAFQMLCKTLKMDFVIDEDTDFRYHKGKVYVMKNGQEKIYDDRGDLDEDEEEKLKRVPNIQSKQRTGHWFDIGSLSCRCSECGTKNNRESNYCPNCGAKMKSEGKR